MTVELASLITATNQVASFPEIVHSINSAVESPHCSLDNIAKIIAEDPGLSAKLLKLANSSFYSFPFPVNTINRALTLIGTRQLRDMVTAANVLKLFPGIPERFVKISLFWQHSIACGVAARTIAIMRRESNVERFYLMGLLHDIGMLVMYSQLPGPSMRRLKRVHSEGLCLHHLEKSDMGFHHALVGGALMRNWNLPPYLYAPITHLYEPSQETTYTSEAAIVHVANIIATAMRTGSSGDYRVPPLDMAAWERIDIPASAMPKLMSQVWSQYYEAVNVMMGE